jgi:hypothetical protein
VNNDDMSDDEFDAFLRGEDALSRRLRGMAEPLSPPKLDAAILGYVKAGLAQEAQAARGGASARPAAANDAVIEGAPPRLAPGMKRRWRIPAGIAAGVLAGVLGHQLYQGGAVRMEERMAAAPPADAPAPAAAATPATATATATAETAAPPPVMVADAAPVPVPSPAAPAPAPPVASAPSAAPKPAPKPAPVQLAAAPPAPMLRRVDAAAPSLRRQAAEDMPPATVIARESAAGAAKPSYQGYNSDKPVPDMPVPAAKAPAPVMAAAPPPAPAAPAPVLAAAPPQVQQPLADRVRELEVAVVARPAPPMAREAIAKAKGEARGEARGEVKVEARARAKVETGGEMKVETRGEMKVETKVEAPAAHDKRARDWLALIDAMLKAKLNKDALAEWARFRAAYPDYPVPAATREAIAALKP